MYANIRNIFGSLWALVILYAWLCGIALLFPIIHQLSNEVLIQTIVGTFVAAAAGTYGAQVVIEKTKNREMLLEEIRNTNAAIMLAFDTFNACFSLKKQRAKPIKEKHDALQEALDRIPQPPPGQFVLFEYQADYSTLAPIFIVTGPLQKQIFEKISAVGRPLALTAALIRAVESLNRSIQERNELIEEMRSMPKETAAQKEAVTFQYFGRTNREGHTDTSFPDFIEAIYRYTDDCIEFSKTLAEDLFAHGENLKKKFGKDAPKVHKVDFSIAPTELMPNPDDYADWYKAFPKSSEAIAAPSTLPLPKGENEDTD